VASGHPDQGLFHRNICHAFGLFDRATDGTHRGIKIDDQPLAQALGLGCAERQKLHQLAFDFRDQHGSFRAAMSSPTRYLSFFAKPPLLQ